MKIWRIEGTIMKVNSYLVQTEAGLVVIDGMLTVSDARAVRRRADELGKRILGAVVTHAHPDHYAGLDEMLRGIDAPIFATDAVKRAIERDDAMKNEIVGPMMGPEWPQRRRFPDRIATDAISFAEGALELRVRDLGPGESPADSIVSLGDRAHFVGDVVYNGMHAYLADGHYAAWLEQLAQLAKEIPPDALLYVGHGEPGPAAELFAAQTRYVEAFVDSVTRNRSLPPDLRRAAVVRDMKRVVPSEDLLFLMELSVDPVAASVS